MIYYSSPWLVKMLLTRVLRKLIRFFPEGRARFSTRKLIAKFYKQIPAELLVNPGDSVLLVGFHKIDSVRLFSYLAGKSGSVVVIEAVPAYIENLHHNLEHYLRWPIDNITYISKGVDSNKGSAQIQIGKFADYNKLLSQDINDGLSGDDFVKKLDIDTDTIDNILNDNHIEHINHIQITISGMELEALKGMNNTLQISGLRLGIRTLHTKNKQPIYPQVTKYLEDRGLRVISGKKTNKFAGMNVYAHKL